MCNLSLTVDKQMDISLIIENVVPTRQPLTNSFQFIGTILRLRKASA